MSLTIQTIEELEKNDEIEGGKDGLYSVVCHPLSNIEDYDTASFLCQMRNNLPDLLSAARWALENGYQEESESEVVDSPEVNMAKVFMNGFEVTYAKDGESVAIDQPNSSSQDGRKGVMYMSYKKHKIGELHGHDVYIDLPAKMYEQSVTYEVSRAESFLQRAFRYAEWIEETQRVLGISSR